MKKFIVFLIIQILLQIFTFAQTSTNISQFRGNEQHSGVISSVATKSAPLNLFSFRTNGAVRSTPVIYKNILLFGSTDGNLYAVNKTSGQEILKFHTNKSTTCSPAVVNDLVVFSSRDKNIYAVNVDNGNLVWKYPTGENKELHWGFDNYLSSPLIVL